MHLQNGQCVENYQPEESDPVSQTGDNLSGSTFASACCSHRKDQRAPPTRFVAFFDKCAGFSLAGAVMAAIGPGVFVWIFAQ